MKKPTQTVTCGRHLGGLKRVGGVRRAASIHLFREYKTAARVTSTLGVPDATMSQAVATLPLYFANGHSSRNEGIRRNERPVSTAQGKFDRAEKMPAVQPGMPVSLDSAVGMTISGWRGKTRWFLTQGGASRAALARKAQACLPLRPS